MRLGDLTAFVAVADELSFRAAAARVGVTPSALSHTMRQLEERLGVRLLHRTTRSVALTDHGRRLLERLRPAIAEIAGALEDLDHARRPAPRTPDDLAHHSCIQYRWGDGVFVWPFERNGQSRRIAVRGPVTVNRPALAVRAAVDGLGIAYYVRAARRAVHTLRPARP